VLVWACSERGRPEKWRRSVWDKLAFVSRYGNVTPNESAFWDLGDLDDFARAIGEIVEQENKTPR
jgi:hypothetical protein